MMEARKCGKTHVRSAEGAARRKIKQKLKQNAKRRERNRERLERKLKEGRFGGRASSEIVKTQSPHLPATTQAAMAETPAAITHVIFDLDGLLIDTEILYTQETQKILSRYGKKFEWSLKSRMMGRKPLDGAKILVDTLGIPLTPEEFHKELYGNLMDQFPDAPFLPGAEQLIQHFLDAGIPLAICTGSSGHTYDCKISKRRELFSRFSHAICSDHPEVLHGKPAPDIYQVAARKFKNAPKSPANVLVFEDAPNGVESAKAAGMNVVMVPDKRTEPEKCRNADRVIESLEALDLTEWGLPPLEPITT